MTTYRNDVTPSVVRARVPPWRDLFRGLAGPPLVAAIFATGCGSNDSNPGGGGPTGGDESGGPDSAAVSNVDGAVASGFRDAGSTEAGSIESGPADSVDSSLRATDAADAGGDGLTDGDVEGDSSNGDTVADVPANFFIRYEAESALNVRTYPVEGVVTDGAQPCAGVPGTTSDGVKEGANCASGGRVVNQVLGRSPCTPPTSTTSYTDCGNLGGGVTFNGVTVPVDGTYDVTFWYHSGQLTPGQADTYGDVNCGGLNYDTGPGSGCRPHLLAVNGVPQFATVGGQKAVYYEFPAYPDSWSIVHGAVIELLLRAGSNTIEIKAPGFTTSDAADIDALDVQPSGKGAPSFQPSGLGGPPALRIGLVTPVVNWN